MSLVSVPLWTFSEIDVGIFHVYKMQVFRISFSGRPYIFDVSFHSALTSDEIVMPEAIMKGTDEANICPKP